MNFVIAVKVGKEPKTTIEKFINPAKKNSFTNHSLLVMK